MSSRAFHAEPVVDNTQVISLMHCLSRANELALGCTAAAIENLPLVLGVLNRILIEELISIQWICASAENAEAFLARSKSEIEKCISLTTERKFSKIINKNSKVDETKNFRTKHPYINKRYPSIEQRAIELDLHKIYTTIYTIFSNYVHGSDMLLKSQKKNLTEQTLLFINAAYGIFSCIFEIIKNFVKYHKITSSERIYELLNI